MYLFYLVYINDLIQALHYGSPNTGILNKPSSCPSLADDLSLIAVTPLALQKLLDIAHRYACKWRFTFNASKSCVLQFRAKLDTCNMSWHLGPAIVSCNRFYNHLGIIINEKKVNSLTEYRRPVTKDGGHILHYLTLVHHS